MTYFVIGDNHFGDARILRYCRNDKFSNVDEMNRYMIEKWNSVVRNKDTVFINGDLSRYTDENDYKFISKLNGKKILIRGNHDNMNDDVYTSNGIFKVYDYPIMYEYLLITHEPYFVNNNSPFVNVYAHVHNNANYKLVSSCGYCTSVEVNDYTPVEMSAIQKLISDERKKIDLSLFE